MRVLNIGSVNIDHVYRVDHFVRPGETLSSARYDTFAGGKGFNQSIALVRAGASTRHAGSVGRDGAWLLDRLAGEGIDISQITTVEAPTGHAIIQVVPSGENAIVLHRGANAAVTPEAVARALSSCSSPPLWRIHSPTGPTKRYVSLSSQRKRKAAKGSPARSLTITGRKLAT